MNPEYVGPVALLILAVATAICGACTGYAIALIRQSMQKPQLLPAETQEALKVDILTVAEWARWNPWYHDDQVLALEAQSIHLALQRDKPGQPLAENLADVSLEMRRRHPDIVTLN